MEFPQNQENSRFTSPKEELDFLRKQAEEQQRKITELEGMEVKTPEAPKFEETQEREPEKVISKQIESYKQAPVEDTLTEEYKITEEEVSGIKLKLAPEKHDDQMAELLLLLEEKGIKNTLSVVEKLEDPHLEDDFHRVLVQYIKEGYPIKNFKEKSPIRKALGMTLYEISLPATSDEETKKKSLKEIISSMEQLYAGLLSVSEEKQKAHFTFEIATPYDSREIIFYSSVPDNKKDLFEKQIISIFPNAKLEEIKDDYNIFGEGNLSAGSHGILYKQDAFPIKTYENFDYDPLNVILNSLSKLEDNEGASIQLVIKPVSDELNIRYKRALQDIKDGIPYKKALEMPSSFLGDILKEAGSFFSKQPKADPEMDPSITEGVENKLSSPILKTNIRILTSAKTKYRTEEILSGIESAFNQFENTKGNKILFKRMKSRKLQKAQRNFSFRLFKEENSALLNTKELTTLLHLPSTQIKSSDQLRQAKAGSAPAPLDITQQKGGVLLGINKHRNTETNIYINEEDRLRHFYVIGQTGTGKTTLLKNMITQDILNGEGVCMIDPHGTDIADILAIIPPERHKDVIYFDPSDTEKPMSLNMLEYDINFPEQKTFVVNEMLSIFNKLFDMKTAGGPMFEQYFRNAVLLVIEHPESGNTLLDISKVLSNKEFREMKLKNCKNPTVVQFWREIAEQAGGEAALENIVPYITSKFDVFLSNEIMRPIVSQQKSSFNFREVMDNKKILLVNLSKGRLGDINSHLIGLIIVGKILMSALSRVDSLSPDLPPFYLYIDEFQNTTTDSISTILSEARKYKLSLNIAHQFIDQLEDNIKSSVFGNVGSMATFRVGSQDAEFLEKQFEPTFTASDIMNLDNRNTYIKMLVNGQPAKPFNIETVAPTQGSLENAETIRQLSKMTYGKDKSEIEKEIAEKYNV
ncbi:helicase HerA domain-containing protein [Patescibacteria group bacterium]